MAAVPRLSDLDLPGNIPSQTEYYEISAADYSLENPGFLKFRVKAEHATYEVVGLRPLAKLLREIEVIEKVRRNEKTSGFFDGAASSVEATRKGLTTLASHPIDSVKGVGKAAGKLGRMVGRAFTKKEKGEQTSFNEKLLGSSKRELAKQFGVDAYTTNPYLNEVLNEMARARLGGKGATVVLKFLIPVAGLASVALTASGVNATADRLVNDSSLPDLFRINQQALLSLGFDRKEAERLLNSSILTPREVTYLRVYLEKLKNIKGYEEISAGVCEAKKPEAARKIMDEAQLAAEEAAQNPNYERLEIFSEGLALADSKRLILVTAYDYLDQSKLGDQILLKANQLAEEWRKNFIEIGMAEK